MLTVHELDKSNEDAWNNLVTESPQGNVFNRTDWLQMLCDTDPSMRVLKLACYDGQEHLVGGQTICWQARGGMSISTDFEFFYSGPMLALPGRKNAAYQVTRKNNILQALSQEMAARLDYLEFETHPALQDIRAFLYAGWQVEPVYTHIWDMRNIDQTWNAMHREKRREIRRAQEQFSFGMESENALEDFLPLYKQTMLKFSWRPSIKWEQVFRERFGWMHKRDGCRLYLARTKDGDMAGGVVVLLSREDNTAYLWRQGSASESVKAGVVPALYWHAALDLANEFPAINFGGSPQSTLSEFKDYLGAKVVPHYMIQRCKHPARFALMEKAMRLKDTLYNIAAPVMHQAWQKLRY